MSKISIIAAAVTLATASVAVNAGWSTPWSSGNTDTQPSPFTPPFAESGFGPRFGAPEFGSNAHMDMTPEALNKLADQQLESCKAQADQTRQQASRQAEKLAAQKKYAAQMQADRERMAKQAAEQRTKAREAQRQYAEQMQAQQAAQQAQAQEAQRQYAEQMAAQQARVAEQMAAQQAKAQEAQRQYAEQAAAQQADALEAHRKYAEQMAANQPAAGYRMPGQPNWLGLDSQSPFAQPPVPFDEPAFAMPSDLSDRFSTAMPYNRDELIKARQERRGEFYKEVDTQRAKMESRHAQLRKQMQERRLARPYRAGSVNPFNRCDCQDI